MASYRIWSVVPLLLVLPCLTVAAPAHALMITPSSPQAMNFTVEGKIIRLAEDTFTLSTGENIIFHVRYGDKTEVKREDGSVGSAKDLRVGLRVRVSGKFTEAGEIIAQKIAILPAAPAKKSAAVPGDGCLVFDLQAKQLVRGGCWISALPNT
jgi:hypothetical protein